MPGWRLEQHGALGEAALTAATAESDLSVLEELLEVLATPDDHERDPAGFGEPGPRERLCQTFCGT